MKKQNYVFLIFHLFADFDKSIPQTIGSLFSSMEFLEYYGVIVIYDILCSGLTVFLSTIQVIYLVKLYKEIKSKLI